MQYSTSGRSLTLLFCTVGLCCSRQHDSPQTVQLSTAMDCATEMYMQKSSWNRQLRKVRHDRRLHAQKADKAMIQKLSEELQSAVVMIYSFRLELKQLCSIYYILYTFYYILCTNYSLLYIHIYSIYTYIHIYYIYYMYYIFRYRLSTIYYIRYTRYYILFCEVDQPGLALSKCKHERPRCF